MPDKTRTVKQEVIIKKERERERVELFKANDDDLYCFITGSWNIVSSLLKPSKRELNEQFVNFRSCVVLWRFTS